MRDVNIGSKKYTKIECLDEAGSGGACHEYQIVDNTEYDPDLIYLEMLHDLILTKVSFQKGPIKENGVNGCQMEDLIAICIDRLDGFQSGQFSCRDNAMAKTKLEEALMWLRKRTQDRIDRGVEGTSGL